MSKPQPNPVAVFEVLPSVSDTDGARLSIDLSVSINAAFVAAKDSANLATDQARHAITAAVQCGDLLNRQKTSLPHGDWLDWLANHCPEISAETARRYMRLANRAQVTDLNDATNLRQAYLATGVLPESARTRREPDVNTPTVTFVRGLDQFRRWFHRRTDELPLDQWTPEARRLLRNELTWFKKLHDRLAA